jgi:hypothetical protein
MFLKSVAPFYIHTLTDITNAADVSVQFIDAAGNTADYDPVTLVDAHNISILDFSLASGSFNHITVGPPPGIITIDPIPGICFFQPFIHMKDSMGDEAHLKYEPQQSFIIDTPLRSF